MYISDLVIISADNKVRFVAVNQRSIHVSENYINIPGIFKNYYFDEYNAAALII